MSTLKFKSIPGVDIVDIERITQAIKNPKFVLRILTSAERDICKTIPKIAGRWAAKEAILKALNTSNINITRWHQIEILNHHTGKPIVTINHPLFDTACMSIEVSISHEKKTAIAFAIFNIYD